MSAIEEVRTRFEKRLRKHLKEPFELIVMPYDGTGMRVTVQRPATRRKDGARTLATVQIRHIGKPWESVHGLLGPALLQIRESLKGANDGATRKGEVSARKGKEAGVELSRDLPLAGKDDGQREGVQQPGGGEEGSEGDAGDPQQQPAGGSGEVVDEP